ncbi:MAG: hypothetical protein IKS55_14530 [Oscillospiraceae bacterium]|nr:hypothetical protein [Oscillospiraceae bacterium]
MENNKKMALSDDQLGKVSGGGVGAAEEYLAYLMDKYHCSRPYLMDYMTPEEYQHYVELYNN